MISATAGLLAFSNSFLRQALQKVETTVYRERQSVIFPFNQNRDSLHQRTVAHHLSWCIQQIFQAMKSFKAQRFQTLPV